MHDTRRPALVTGARRFRAARSYAAVNVLVTVSASPTAWALFYSMSTLAMGVPGNPQYRSTFWFGTRRTKHLGQLRHRTPDLPI